MEANEYEKAWGEEESAPLSEAVQEARKKAKEEDDRRKKEYADAYAEKASEDTEGGGTD